MPVEAVSPRRVGFAPTLLGLAFAASALVASSCDGRREIAVIENDLVADDPAVRANAASELNDWFPDSAVAVPMLVDLLDDEDPTVVAAAAKAIDSMAVAAAPVLTSFCADPANFQGPHCFGRSLEGLLTIRLLAPLDCFGTGDDPEDPTTPANCACGALVMGDRTSREAWSRARAVGAFRRTDGETREMAAAALAMLGADAVAAHSIAPPADPRRVPAARALVPLIESEVAVQAFCGARIAARLRCADPVLLKALGVSLTRDKLAPDSWSRRGIRFAPAAAADAFASIGPEAAVQAGFLYDCVRSPPGDRGSDESADLVDRCVRALVRTGREQAIETLMRDDESVALHLARVAAESGCSPALVLPRLTAQASKPDPPSEAFLGLCALGPAAISALPLAKARLRSATDDTQRAARAETVLHIARDDSEALEILDALLGDHDLSGSHSDPDSASDAWYTLCERAAPTPMVLRRLTAGVSPGTLAFGFREAASALGRAGPAAKDAVPALVELLHRVDGMNEGWRISSLPVVIVALGRIGPDAAAAVPSLTLLRDKGDETIRVPAAQALRRIRAKK